MRCRMYVNIYYLITSKVQKMYLTFMADLLGDVASSLGPPCEIATAASVLSSFQEGRFLSGGSIRWGCERDGWRFLEKKQANSKLQ